MAGTFVGTVTYMSPERCLGPALGAFGTLGLGKGMVNKGRKCDRWQQFSGHDMAGESSSEQNDGVGTHTEL